MAEKSLAPLLGQLGSWEKGFQRAEAIQDQAPPVYFGMENILFKLKNPNIRQLAISLKEDLNLLEYACLDEVLYHVGNYRPSYHSNSLPGEKSSVK